ncbi:unnamed protein product, partial [Mesorhabditis belari]|uniref:Neurotransmitter-gated ion-channel ligand-binding domain-containing protein n=1 Tax=Mesorhabditis belari TaxID=2138241 RepID=A0AAF3EKP7_9BILA
MANLYNELFNDRHYNRELSPVFEGKRNFSGPSPPPLQIIFVLDYLQIFGLDAQSQLLSTCIQLRISWLDPRLSWDPANHDGIEQLHVLADTIWIPDAQFGSVKTLDDMSPGLNKAVKVTSDGWVETVTPYYMEIACQITISSFPFDNQSCELPLLSFSYASSLIATNGSVGQRVGAQLSARSIGNGEWECTGIDQLVIEQGGVQLFCFYINLKRVPNYYVYVIAVPCFVMTFLSILGMFWKRNNESKHLDRLLIGLTSLISMTLLLDLLSNAIPKTSVFPLLGVYVTACIGLTSVSCLLIIVWPAKDLRKSLMEREKKMESAAEQNLSKSRRYLNKIKANLYHRHIIFHAILHLLNLIGFIVFLSFWK